MSIAPAFAPSSILVYQFFLKMSRFEFVLRIYRIGLLHSPHRFEREGSIAVFTRIALQTFQFSLDTAQGTFNIGHQRAGNDEPDNTLGVNDKRQPVATR